MSLATDLMSRTSRVRHKILKLTAVEYAMSRRSHDELCRCTIAPVRRCHTPPRSHNDQLGSTAGRGGVLHRMPVCCWKLNQGGAPMHAANGKFDAVVAGKGATVTGGVDACRSRSERF